MKFAHITLFSLIAVLISAILVLPTVNASTPKNHPVLRLEAGDQATRLNMRDEAFGYFTLPANFTLQNKADLNGIIASVTDVVSVPDFEKNRVFGLYIPLVNLSENAQWMVHINRFLIDSVEIYAFSGEQVRHYDANFRADYQDDAQISVFGRAVPIELPPEQPVELLIILSSESFVPPVSVDLYSAEKYAQVTSKASNLFTFSMGIVFSSIAASLVCFLLLREPTFFWYAISSSLMATLTLTRSYLGIAFLEPDNGLPGWFWFLIFATEICLLKFVISFLSSANDPPLLRQFYDKGFKVLGTTLFFALLLTELLFSRFILVFVSIGFGLLIVMIAVGLGLYYAFKQRRYYILFSLGWLPIFFRIIEKAIALNLDPSSNSNAILYNPTYDPVYQAIHFFVHLAALLLRVADNKKREQEAETKQLAKTLFLASISHDLRQPIHSMQLLTNHLEGEVHSKQGKLVLNQLQLAQCNLDNTFNALMDWSQLEAGKIQINLEQTDISVLINDVKSEFVTMAAQKGIELRIQTRPFIVTTDPLLLSRILRNLLSNAIKYTDSGGVLLTTRSRQKQLVIEIWDTGCGIPQQEQTMIFDLYQRAKHYSQNVTGSGIGLANVKQIADALGYKVSLSSRLNRGSVFRLNVAALRDCPLKQVAKADECSSAPLIVNYINERSRQQHINKLLRRWGYTTITADKLPPTESNGQIYLFDEITACEQYFADKLRPGAAPSKYIYVGLVGADTLPENTSEILKLHALNQPVNPAELRAFIRYVETQLQPNASATNA